MILWSVSGARLLALAQGTIWFFLLLHGGLGPVFAPLGLAAAGIGKRSPPLAAVLLALPAAFLIVSWAPVILNPTSIELREWIAVIAVIAPALMAMVIFLRTHLLLRDQPAA